MFISVDSCWAHSPCLRTCKKKKKKKSLSIAKTKSWGSIKDILNMFSSWIKVGLYSISFYCKSVYSTVVLSCSSLSGEFMTIY